MPTRFAGWGVPAGLFDPEPQVVLTVLLKRLLAIAPFWIACSMYGKKYFGNERTTFVLGADGKVARVLRKVKPAEHDDLALKALEEHPAFQDA